MRFEPTPIDGAWLLELESHEDERGSFARTYCDQEFADHGLPTHFPQCNLSRNTRTGTMRGMHYNVAAHAEAKLVRCVRGAVHDVVVDLRRGSPTWRRRFGVDLTADNGRALFVPEGLAHGFLTLTDHTDVYYHMSEMFRPDAARGLRWDDPAVGIQWPSAPVVISDRDASYPDVDLDQLDG
jgi:dTDP-4-dehydrorhamnose 3,5-epimerase